MSRAKLRRNQTWRTVGGIGGALIVSLMLSALAGTAAQASTWTVEGKGIGEEVALESGLKKETTASLTGKVLGQEVVITAKRMAGSGGVIIQSGSIAKTSGIIEFSEVSVDKPSGCVLSSPVVTKTLTSEAVDHSGNEHAFGKTFPEEGEVFATIKITGCAIAGSYNVKTPIDEVEPKKFVPTGVFGEAEKWGTELSSQPIKTTPAVNETMNGSLTLGTSPAQMTAETVGNLASGNKFSVDT